jgi:hypothetical protein
MTSSNNQFQNTSTHCLSIKPKEDNYLIPSKEKINHENEE